MRKIKQLSVEYVDGTSETWDGNGSAYVAATTVEVEQPPGTFPKEKTVEQRFVQATLLLPPPPEKE